MSYSTIPPRPPSPGAVVSPLSWLDGTSGLVCNCLCTLITGATIFDCTWDDGHGRWQVIEREGVVYTMCWSE